MIPWGLPDFVPLLRTTDSRVDFVANVSSAGWWDWEDPLPVALAALAPKFPGAFYDVGANTGFYSVLMGRLDPARAVRPFEPIPRLAQACGRNLQRCGLDGVAVELVALSDHSGTAQLYVPPVELGMMETKASLRPSFNAEVAEAITVVCETLDQSNARLGGEHLGMAKVDVEGAEHLVLAGATATIRRDRPLLSIELLADAEYDLIAGQLAELDYVALAMGPGLVVRVEDRPAYQGDSWNHLLLPSEFVSSCLAELHRTAEEFRAVRALLQELTPADYVGAYAAALPSDVLATQIAVLTGDLGEARDQIAKLRREQAATRAELTAVTSSASWRLSRPLRSVKSLVSRRTTG